MAIRHTRRAALVRLGLGSAGVVVGARLAPDAEAAGATDLATRFRKCSADGMYDVAAKAIRSGATPSTLLAASFLAGVQDIRPHGVGGKFHAVLMVESAYQLTEVSSPTDAYRIALWTLWDFKRCQERDREEEGDWKLPARPEARFPNEAAARKELVAAMDAWDVERADRAIVALLPSLDRASMFNLLWPYGARCYADLGHKIIFCAHADRTLARVGWSQAEPALRSLVRGLLYVTDAGPQTASWDSSLAQVERIPANWLDGTNDVQQSLDLLRALRGKNPVQSQQVVVDALIAGVGIDAIWDGLRLHASEVFYRRTAAAERRHVTVHPVTEMNAFAHAWRSTSDTTLRKRLLMQAAAWIGELSQDLERIYGKQRSRRLDALGEDTQRLMPGLSAVFERPSEATACHGIDASADGAERYLALLRENLYERAFQDHQYKYVAALHEESTAAHPRWRSAILGPSITYIPTRRDPRTEMRKRSDAALIAAGVL